MLKFNNKRRCELIDKEIDGQISISESMELELLQNEMLEYRKKIAPLPIKEVEQLYKQLKQQKEKIMSDRKVVPLIEGRVSKGGQNPPNLSTTRPPAPQGSGGTSLLSIDTREQYIAMKPLREESCTLSRCESVVSIACDSLEDAEKLLDWLEEQSGPN